MHSCLLKLYLICPVVEILKIEKKTVFSLKVQHCLHILQYELRVCFSGFRRIILILAIRDRRFKINSVKVVKCLIDLIRCRLKFC